MKSLFLLATDPKNKKWINIFLLLCAAGGGLLSLALIVSGIFDSTRGCDFFHRHNEIQDLLAHINPYEKWKTFTEVRQWVRLPNVPWAYMVALPICWLPRPSALFVYTLVELLCITLIMLWAFCYLRKSTGNWVYAAFLCSFMLIPAVRKDLNVANYALLCTVSLCGMIYFLDRKQPELAALCWSLLMVKPVLGALFFFPLLFGRQYRVILLSIAICAVASIIPAWMIHENPIRMILQTSELGVGLCNDCVRGGLFVLCYKYKVADPMLIYRISFILGLVVVGATGFYLRNCKSWLLRMLPAAVYSVMWTYSNSYNLNLLIPVYVALGTIMFVSEKKLLRVFAALLFFVAMVPLRYNSGAVTFFLKYSSLLLTLAFLIIAIRVDSRLDAVCQAAGRRKEDVPQ